jgi:hypothetical protein
MKAQASSNLKAQAPGGGGTRPQALDTFKVNATWRRRRLRQIVARRFVILTRDPRSKHQGSSCVNLSYIFLIKKMRLSFYVNLTNGGKNGINLRLQAHRYRSSWSDDDHQVAHGFCWVMMSIDMREVTEKNWKEILFRIKFLQKIGFGPWTEDIPEERLQPMLKKLIGYMVPNVGKNHVSIS